MNQLTKLLTKLQKTKRNQSFKGMARKRFGNRLYLERLEERELMAGDVSITVADFDINEIGDVSTFIASGSGGLSAPRSLVQGPDGNIYVASAGNHSVLRYSGTTGAFLNTFVAAGSGGLNSPDGVAFGPDGNFYVASGGTDSILKYNGASGAFISAFVPSGSGGLDNPRGLRFGPSGSLYVSSFLTDSILRYSDTSGTFQGVFVAPGSGGLSRPLDLVFGPDGDLYVGVWDLGSPSAVSRYSGLTGSFVSNFVPRGSGGISNPRGLTFDQDGRLYVADFDTNSIHRYDSQGQYLDDPVGSAASPLRIPMGITFDTQGRLLISSNNWDTNSVFRYDRGVVVSLSTASATATTVDYQTVNGSAVAPGHYTAQTGKVNFAAGQTTRRILLASKDDALVNGSRTFTLQLSNPSIGATIGTGSAVITIADDDATRQILVSDTSATEGEYKAHYRGTFIESLPGVHLGNSVMFHGGYFYSSPGPSSLAPIDRYDATTGAFVDHFIPASRKLSGIRTPVIWGGFLYVGSEYTDEVQRYNAANGAPAGISGIPGDAVFVSAGSGIDGPHGLSFGPDGNLYVTGRNSFNVARYHGTTGQPLGTLDTSGAGALRWPENLAIDGAGVAYVASTGTNQIQKYSTVTGVYLGAITSTALTSPKDVKFGPDGLLYVLSTGNSRILRFTTAGVFVDDYVQPGSGGLNNMARMAFGPDGDLYVSGYYSNNFIYRFGTENEAIFNVTLSTPSSVPVTLDYATTNLVPPTALAGSDYTARTGTLTIAPGFTKATVRVPLLNDSALENSEAFSLIVSNASGGTIIDGSGTATITDDDQSAKFYVVNDATATIPGTNATYEYTTIGGAIESYGLELANLDPRGAASTAAGTKTWVVDANKKVYVYDPSGALLGSWNAGGLSQPEGIATNGTDVWIVDAGTDKVYRYTAAANLLAGSQNALSSFKLKSGSNTNPKDIVTDGTNLWVVDDGTSDRVFKYTVSGTFLGSWTINSGGGSPTGITLDPSNASQSLWIVDSNSDSVYEYANARGKISGSQAASMTFVLAAGNTNPQGIADPPPPAMIASDALVSIAEKRNVKTLSSSNPFIAQVDSIFENWNEDSLFGQTKKRLAGRR